MRAMRRWTLVAAFLALAATMVSSCVPRITNTPSHEPVTLRFAYREHTVELETSLNAFHERYPWITVEPVVIERFGAGMGTMLEASAVDMFRDGRSAFQYLNEGMIRPLDEVQLGDWSDIRDDYFRGAWEGLRIQGQQWGVPAGLDILVAYVNMDQAQALKVKVPDPKTNSTWDLLDFTEMAVTMNYPEGLPHAESARLFGFCSSPEGIDPVVFIYLHGGKIVDDLNAPSEVTLDHPYTVEAVQWYSDLYNQFGVIPDPAVIRTTFRRGGIWEAATRGACGVWTGWYSNRGGLDVDERAEWQSAWRMLPLPSGRESISLGDVEGYYITKDCQNPREALILLRFLSDSWEASGTRLPPRRSLATSDEYVETIGDDIATVAARFADRVMMLPAENSEAFEKIGSALIGAVKQIVAEDLNAADVLGEAQQQVRTVFQQP